MSSFKTSDAVLLSAALAIWLAEGKDADEIAVLGTFFLSLGNNLAILAEGFEAAIIQPSPITFAKNDPSGKV